MMAQVDAVAFASVVGAFVMAVCCTAIYYSYLAWKVWQEIALKRDLVARGYAAAEIVAIIAAEPGAKVQLPLPNVPPAKPIKQPVYNP